MFIELSRINMWVSSAVISDIDYSDDYSELSNAEREKKKDEEKKLKKGISAITDDEWFTQQKEKKKKNETLYYPCDKKSDLYVLQQNFILHNRGYSLDVPTNDSR